MTNMPMNQFDARRSVMNAAVSAAISIIATALGQNLTHRRRADDITEKQKDWCTKSASARHSKRDAILRSSWVRRPTRWTQIGGAADERDDNKSDERRAHSDVFEHASIRRNEYLTDECDRDGDACERDEGETKWARRSP